MESSYGTPALPRIAREAIRHLSAQECVIQRSFPRNNTQGTALLDFADALPWFSLGRGKRLWEALSTRTPQRPPPRRG
jgi:hypothetical protein